MCIPDLLHLAERVDVLCLVVRLVDERAAHVPPRRAALLPHLIGLSQEDRAGGEAALEEGGRADEAKVAQAAQQHRGHDERGLADA